MSAAQGTIHSYDPEKQQGHIRPDGEEDETIPFDHITEGQPLREGDRVQYDVVGGLAGNMAKEVRRIAPEAAGAPPATSPE